MKKHLVVFLLAFVLILSTVPVQCAVQEFSDVPNTHAAYDAVAYLVKRGIVNGETESEFYPDNTVKREEVAKIIAKAALLTIGEKKSSFEDVPLDSWFGVYIDAVRDAKLMAGVSDIKFGVGATLTRQDLAVILDRLTGYAHIILPSGDAVLYADNEDISEYAAEAVSRLSHANIFTASTDKCFYPKSEATRSEVTISLYKVLTLQEEQNTKLGRYAPVSQYDGPFDVPADDKVAKLMPTPFDVKKWPREEILFEDFEDNNFDMLQQGYFTDTVSYDYNGGYSGKGCIKIKNSGSAILSFNTSDYRPGDYLVFSCMIKAEGVSGTGKGRNILQVYDDDNKWLDETHAGVTPAGNMEWFEMQQILAIPAEANALSLPDFYKINLVAYMQSGLTGNMYFDDFRVYKVIFDPMETVLVTPNYKGIIYGDGGIGDINLKTFINESNGSFDLNQFSLAVQIADKNENVLMISKSDKVTPEMDVFFSSKDLKMNEDYYIQAILYHKESNKVRQKQEWTLRKRAKDFSPLIHLDEYNRVIKNGEPVLPLRMYNYTNYDDFLEAVLNSDIEEFGHTGFGWYYNFSDPKYQKLIETLEEHGVGIRLATGSMMFSNMYTGEVSKRVKKQDDIRGLLTKIVNNFKELPALDNYYLFDEQNPVRYGEELRWANEIIADLDLNHPTTCAIADVISNRPGIYAKTADFLGTDPYPITGRDDQDLSLVGRQIRDLKKLAPNRPVYGIIQGFWYDTRKDLRGPTQQEYRNMMFQSICEGSCMIDSWSYRWQKEKPSPGMTFEKEWAGQMGVLAEIKYVRPIILSVLPVPYYEVRGGGDWLNHMSKRYGGKSYLFMVNNQNQAKMAKVYLDGVEKIKGMYSGKVYEANDAGWFEVDFDNLEVEIFEYDQADYLSSHAQLKRFGLMEDTQSFIIADSGQEKPVFLVAKDTARVNYKAVVSDYAALYIDGTKVDTSGSIDLTGKNEIKVKVISQDGRFTTEKIYLIQRS